MIWTIVLAAGAGTRYGAPPKQHELLGGTRVVERSIQAAATTSDGVVLVTDADHVDLGPPGIQACVIGGASRAASVRAGLAAVPDEATVIVVHDAARPLATSDLFERVVRAVEAGADAAVPALPVVDTVKRVIDDRVVETLDRASLVAVQTPQAFEASVLRRAHRRGGDATDDAGLVELVGATVVVVAGESRNLKITVPDDLLVAEAWLQ